MVFFAEGSLRYALAQHVSVYQRERSHQGIGNQSLEASGSPECVCGASGGATLGRILRFYDRIERLRADLAKTLLVSNVVLLPEIARARDASVTAGKILLAITAPYRIDAQKLHVTASIGIATGPCDGPDPATLLKHADYAMYHAKECGRNNYQYFKPDMNLRPIARQSVERDLRSAIERMEFELYNHPKMDLRTHTMVGLEALIRWHHPERGLLCAADFITVTEDRGLITQIGRWALGEACRQSRVWQDQGIGPSRNRGIAARGARSGNNRAYSFLTTK